jgi:hypothetical protein
VTACEYNTVHDKQPGNEEECRWDRWWTLNTVVLLRYKDGSSDLGLKCKLEFGVDKRMTYTIQQERNLRRGPDKVFTPKIVLGIPKQLNECD